MEATLDPLNLVARGASLEIAQAESRSEGETIEIDVAGGKQERPGAEAIALLRRIYCGNAALEADHIVNGDDRRWLYEQFEREMLAEPDETLYRETLEAVLLADEFERFIKTKWPTKKRFGSEGSEASMVILREALAQAAGAGLKEVVIGGMHRGRLATLATVLGKSLPTLIAEIKGVDVGGGSADFTGDVPYHNGLASTIDTRHGALDIRLLPHPSHLSVVAPIALGAARARLEMRQAQGQPQAVMPLLMHTDAAFAGQGVISELLQLGGLAGYTGAGAIHLVVNNQIGFTTLPGEGRSTPYPTDIGKAYGLPVFHVNGDDPMAASAIARLAFAWRQHTGRDALINLVCYRRHGHNELDEPRFTQPRIWAAVDAHPTLPKRYAETVAGIAPAAAASAEARRAVFAKQMAEAFENYGHTRSNSATDQMQAFPRAAREGGDPSGQTGVPADRLIELAQRMTTLPDGFEPDPKVATFLKNRLESVQADTGINMATAEALAFGSLLAEGTSVRLSGQDCVRGTFTQRHLAIHDRRNGASSIPLAQTASASATFDAINSPLTEYGILAFEYGMSLADPDKLIVWEAQFGDFVNGAQIAVDQYIVSAEAKWRMQSSLVIALPHGLEGQGPDHSSAKIERLLQSCAGQNIIVANPSTPANLFHLLRRQQRGAAPKPLFLIAPKSLLRDKRCQSVLADLQEGTSFQPVIPRIPGKSLKRLILCSGKIFYALDDALKRDGLSDIGLVRIEQLYPFPQDTVVALLKAHAKAELVWCQEEPRNQGAYAFVADQLHQAIPAAKFRFVGRPAMAAAAGGSIDRHDGEQEIIVSAAVHGVEKAAIAAE
ncbi:2-oxoglutarate dehydrogenase E1 component [Sphingomonas abietis]|uniref:2-oxoglutarate dehydrogenase E1 component n=1 Tax=Sphingomonas abietis TaxID=3012344 RepID=A0ABY7NKD4_9SPHN|nr:2-oxoglutarate dehydrogenase E1 component [Sphingomonas abietis]WBO21984.1 2-oxoglutarate dehydrogenase E1 component [Sphingomonas abietis]